MSNKESVVFSRSDFVFGSLDLSLFKIEEIDLPETVATVPMGSSLVECVEYMRSLKMGSVLVVDESGIQGIFTERDILNKIVLEGMDLHKTSVNDYMSANPKTVHVKDTLDKAISMMIQHGFRHLVVQYENQNLYSILSVKDVLKFIMNKNTEQKG